MSLPVAIVTGAARRIGLAIAERLAREGYAVLLHASPASAEAAEAEARRLCAEGAVAATVAADLTELATPGRIVTAAAALGPLALLVNSAAQFEPDDAEEPDPALIDSHMAVNLRAPVLLASAFAAGVGDGRPAAIVNLIDQRVLHPNPLYFSYTLSKAALWTATQTMAQAYAPRGIRVNAVAPGPTLPSRHHGEDGFRHEVGGLPLRRGVRPAEIAEAVLYLARAESVTGQLLAVDGGQHLGWETPDLLGYEGTLES